MKSGVIAKNTLFLFIRSIVVLVLTLYTSRVVLNTLGVEDFGIFNVVGGLATMFVFISSTMTNAINRFLSFELGRNALDRVNNVFSCSIIIQLAIAIVIIIISETLGLWLLYSKLSIPADRFSAAFWVYQFAVGLCVVQITRIPYDALIISHERFNIFAYFSIANVLLRLIVAIALPFLSVDKLVVYSLLIFILGIIMNEGYRIYARKHFPQIRFNRHIDKDIIKSMFSFSGWTFLGNIAWMGYTKGIDLLLNIFLGPVVNAANAIAQQIQAAVGTLSSNIQSAMNPQIIKSYSDGQLDNMHKLIVSNTKYSFFLVWAMFLPIFFETEIILKLWLKDVINYSVILTRMILILCLLNTLSRPLMTGIHATGNIKLLQIVESAILLTIVPISYITLKLGMPAHIPYVVYICVELVTQLARMFIILPRIKYPFLSYCQSTFFKLIPVVLISFVLSLPIHIMLGQGILRLLMQVIFGSAILLFAIFYFGITKKEKEWILVRLKKI
ncbi:MAG: hypothetical protein PHX08_03920 [Lachnospiraceae bacterium]|nr:hypothetical protein [Lachnospiraceae bacterium]